MKEFRAANYWNPDWQLDWNLSPSFLNWVGGFRQNTQLSIISTNDVMKILGRRNSQILKPAKGRSLWIARENEGKHQTNNINMNLVIMMLMMIMINNNMIIRIVVLIIMSSSRDTKIPSSNWLHIIYFLFKRRRHRYPKD